MNSTQPTQPVKTAVVTGGHPYDVINFSALFRRMDGVDAYIQHIDDFSAASREVRESYDVILFYIMMLRTPQDEGTPVYAGKPRTALEDLGRTNQGIVVLHHAILAYPEWSLWNDIVGVDGRIFSYDMDQDLEIKVATKTHPITQGMLNWKMRDETYKMGDAGEGNTILLTTDHPKSLKTIAWSREFRNSRVFCLQSGHDHSTYENTNFQALLKRGIDWTARRI